MMMRSIIRLLPLCIVGDEIADFYSFVACRASIFNRQIEDLSQLTESLTQPNNKPDLTSLFYFCRSHTFSILIVASISISSSEKICVVPWKVVIASFCSARIFGHRFTVNLV